MNNILYMVPPITEKTLEEKTTEAKKQRFYLLLETDWTQVVDVPQIVKDKWAPYRQELRDITTQSTFPLNVIWPTKPE